MRKSAASARARRLSNQAEDVVGTLREAVIMVLTMAMVALIMDFPMVFLTTTLRLVLPIASRENYVRPFLPLHPYPIRLIILKTCSPNTCCCFHQF